MENINIELFRNGYKKIEEKLKQISDIPKYWGEGVDFDGIEIDEDGILYKSSTSWPGCQSDYFSFFVFWNELNNPIQYFEEKYAKEIQQKADEKKKVKDLLESQVKEQELKKLSELMEKYKGDIK